MKLLSLIGAILVLLVLGFFTMRFWGLGQTYVPFDHPILNQKPPVIFINVDTPEEAKIIDEETDQYVLVLPIYLTKDEQVIVLKEKTVSALVNNPKFKALSESKMVPPKVQYFTLTELLDMGPAIHNLEGFLQTFPQRMTVFTVNENVENIHKKVLELVQKNNPKGVYGVASDIEVVIKSMKEIRPLTAFSLSRGEQVRFLSFASIGLLPALDITGDFVFSPLTWRKRPLVTSDLVSEMHRRHKKVFIGPISDSEELHQVQSLEADGLIFADIETFANLKNLIRF